MNGRRAGYAAWLTLCGALYFFENNAGTRAVLLGSILMGLIPGWRAAMFGDPGRRRARRVDAPEPAARVETGGQGDPFDIRPYQPGDPLNRIHWKLTARVGEPLLRQPEPEAREAASTRPAPKTRPVRRTAACALMIAGVLVAAMTLVIPAARHSAMALLDRLFDASESANAYAYERFAVPAGASIAPAAALLSLSAGLTVVGAMLISRRVSSLCLAAILCLGQAYFGLSLPAWLNVALLGGLGVLAVRWPGGGWRGPLCAAALAALAVALLWPGVHAGTEAASETVRDWLSPPRGASAQALDESDDGELAVRRVHERSILYGQGAALRLRGFDLVIRGKTYIGRPEWFDIARAVMLMLGAVALVVGPFVPIAALAARRRRAMKAREAFWDADVRAAVKAIFAQVVAWLEAVGLGGGNALMRDWPDALPDDVPAGYADALREGALLYEEAAYSAHPMDGSARDKALDLLDRTEKAMLARSDWRQRLKLRYVLCLTRDDDAPRGPVRGTVR